MGTMGEAVVGAPIEEVDADEAGDEVGEEGC